MQLCGFEVGLNRPFILLAGPCVIESEQLTLDIAGKMKEITDKLGIPYVFKASYDKANRSSDTSFRGLGMANGLRILEEVRRQIGVPVVTDVHTADEVPEVASVVDLLQTPAFLCRQTDFIAACAKSGKPVNIKKGQFLAPQDMKQVVLKARHAAAAAGLSEDRFMVCERGACFGYNNLVSDMRSLVIMRDCDAPVISMRRIPFSSPAVRAQAPAAAENLFLLWPARLLRSVFPVSLWKRTRTPAAPRATDRTWCRSIRWKRC